MELISSIIGKFHPLIVHLPIGILVIAFIIEVIIWFRGLLALRQAVDISLLIGALSAILSCVTGYFISGEGGYPDKLLTQHQYLGIGTAVLTSILYLVRKLPSVIKNERPYLGVVLFLPVMVILTLTGHAGGSLTHGEEFLSFPDVDPSLGKTTIVKPISNIDEAILYSDVVEPILQQKCYSCHSSKKRKGDLRLDDREFIIRGGEHGKIIVEGLPDSSFLFKSLVFPIEDDRHMPPREKEQLTSTEIAIIQSWILEGADFTARIKDLSEKEKIKSYIVSLQTPRLAHWVPEAEVSAPDKAKITALQSRGVLILPVAEGGHYLTANFLNKKVVSDEDLILLKSIKEQLLWLNLEGTSVTDVQLQKVGLLTNLRILNVSNTTITDDGVRSLALLKELRILNIVDTNVTDKTFDVLLALEHLQKVFIYKTKTTREGIDSYSRLRPGVALDNGGYVLPPLSTDTVVYKRKV